MENKTSAGKPQQENPPKRCRCCGSITPFDPDTPGYCCPFCGVCTVAPKKEEKETGTAL